MCTLQTSPCVPATRPHAQGIRTCCGYTQRRFGWTHGEGREQHEPDASSECYHEENYRGNEQFCQASFTTYRVHTCVFAHPTSYILHPISYIRHSTFDIRLNSPPFRCHPKKVATSDGEQAQQRPGQLRSSRQSPALSGHLPSHQVVAFLTGPCIAKFLCQRNVAVGGDLENMGTWQTRQVVEMARWRATGFECGEFR